MEEPNPTRFQLLIIRGIHWVMRRSKITLRMVSYGYHWGNWKHGRMTYGRVIREER